MVSPRNPARRHSVARIYESVVAKVRHAFISIPAGKGLLSPFNRLRQMQPPPPIVFSHRNIPLLSAVRECRSLLRASTTKPTGCRELVMSHGHGLARFHWGEGCLVTRCRRRHRRRTAVLPSNRFFVSNGRRTSATTSSPMTTRRKPLLTPTWKWRVSSCCSA